MTLPASSSRVRALLRRLSPVWPSTDPDTSVGKELDTTADTLALVADPLDGALDEVFPDTTTQLASRWEKIAKLVTREDVDIATRRIAIQSVLRRVNGPRIDQLGPMLAGPFDLDVNDIVFMEQLRSTIETALTVTDSTSRTITTTPTPIYFSTPWPGLVDDLGVKVTTVASAHVSCLMTITSPSGKSHGVGFFGSTTFEIRDFFTGEPAAGTWTFAISTDSGTVTLSSLSVRVSNDVDSAQIYTFFALRDAALAGSPNIAQAQQLFAHTAMGHNVSLVIERAECIVDDPHSLCDREPVGD